MSRLNVEDIAVEVKEELKTGRPIIRILREFPSVIISLRGLTTLDMNGHRIGSIPDALGEMTTLKRIGMVACCLKEIPACIGRLTSLVAIVMKGNQIRTIHPSVMQLPQVQEMLISDNQIETMPSQVTKSLKHFKFAGNRMTELPADLGDCPNLEKLECLGNRLVTLPTNICRLNGVVELQVQGNRIAHLPDLTGMNSLKKLMLSDNCLTSLPPMRLPHLEWLQVQCNRLPEIPQSLVTDCPVRRLLLEGNPLKPAFLANLFGAVLSAQITTLSVISLDNHQVTHYQECMAKEGRDATLPTIVSYGMLLHSNRQFKLIKSDMQSSATVGGNFLIVAFAASFGEPEWAGQLAKIKTQANSFGN